MRIAVLGTGFVGRTIATKLVELEHDVVLGSRSELNEVGSAWAAESGPRASLDTFAGAAAYGDVVFNCTPGRVSVEVLSAIGEKHLEGKLLVDVSNPIDSDSSDLRLTVGNGDSLGEQIQRALPTTHVVKSLNTVNAGVMVNPSRVPGRHVMFIAGNHGPAKGEAADLLFQFGWPRERIVDLGGIDGARAMEANLFMWLRLAQTFDTYDLNIAVEHRS